MVYNVAWDESQPDGSEVANTIDTELQNLKEAVRERMNDVLSNDWAVDGDDPKLLDGAAFEDGAVTYAARASERARVTLGSNEVIANATSTPIPWDNEVIDEGDLVDLGTDATRITIVNDGFYLIVAGLYWGVSGTGYRFNDIQFNGSEVGARVSIPAPSGTVSDHVTMTWMGALSAADYVRLVVYQTSTGNLDIQADASTFMSIVRLA